MISIIGVTVLFHLLFTASRCEDSTAIEEHLIHFRRLNKEQESDVYIDLQRDPINELQWHQFSSHSFYNRIDIQLCLHGETPTDLASMECFEKNGNYIAEETLLDTGVANITILDTEAIGQMHHIKMVFRDTECSNPNQTLCQAKRTAYSNAFTIVDISQVSALATSGDCVRCYGSHCGVCHYSVEYNSARCDYRGTARRTSYWHDTCGGCGLNNSPWTCTCNDGVYGTYCTLPVRPPTPYPTHAPSSQPTFICENAIEFTEALPDVSPPDKSIVLKWNAQSCVSELLSIYWCHIDTSSLTETCQNVDSWANSGRYILENVHAYSGSGLYRAKLIDPYHPFLFGYSSYTFVSLTFAPTPTPTPAPTPVPTPIPTPAPTTTPAPSNHIESKDNSKSNDDESSIVKKSGYGQ